MFSVTFIVFLCLPRFQLLSCSRLQCCFLVHEFFIVRVALSFVLGFFCISYILLLLSFSRQFFFSCAWSSLQFNVWVFARPSISSLSRYRLVSIAFVSFAFLVCLIDFVQFVGCFILTLFCLIIIFQDRYTSHRFTCFPSPVAISDCLHHILKMQLNLVRQVLDGRLIEFTTMEKLQLEQQKGGRDRLIEVATQQRFNFPFFSTINNYSLKSR